MPSTISGGGGAATAQKSSKKQISGSGGGTAPRSTAGSICSSDEKVLMSMLVFNRRGAEARRAFKQICGYLCSSVANSNGECGVWRGRPRPQPFTIRSASCLNSQRAGTEGDLNFPRALRCHTLRLG